MSEFDRPVRLRHSEDMLDALARLADTNTRPIRGFLAAETTSALQFAYSGLRRHLNDLTFDVVLDLEQAGGHDEEQMASLQDAATEIICTMIDMHGENEAELRSLIRRCVEDACDNRDMLHMF